MHHVHVRVQRTLCSPSEHTLARVELRDTWFRAATNQKFDASLAATLPRHDADDIMAELNSECNNLYKLAKQSDVEIA